jgi:hypothetical protein
VNWNWNGTKVLDFNFSKDVTKVKIKEKGTKWKVEWNNISSIYVIQQFLRELLCEHK